MYYSAGHGFWTVEFSNCRLGASHKCNDRLVFGLVLGSATVSTAADVTLKFQGHNFPPPPPPHFTTPIRPVRQLR
jgi:hypothetical protein